MPRTYGLPQPLTGAETITIEQDQDGQVARCTMPLNALVALLGSTSTAWAASLPTSAPATAGVVWNNNGTVSIS